MMNKQSKIFRMTTRNKTGFTAFEMAMVLLVLAILFILIITGFNKISENAKIAGARALTASSPVKNIPNLALWLESTSKNSFIASEINSNPKNISVWYDINKQSEFQNNATQATSALRPTYTTNAINGLPAVFFGNSSSNLGMAVNTTLDIVGNYSIFLVFKTGSSTSGRALQSSTLNWLLGTHSTPCICHYANTGWISNNVSQTPNKVYLTDVVRSSTSRFYINGVDNTVDSAPNAPPRNLALGGFGQQLEPMNGYIGEVIVYTRALSTEERQDVENYLLKKWSI